MQLCQALKDHSMHNNKMIGNASIVVGYRRVHDALGHSARTSRLVKFTAVRIRQNHDNLGLMHQSMPATVRHLTISSESTAPRCASGVA